jgi:hypothetical protein
MEEKDKKGFLVLMAMLAEAFKEDVSTERAKIYFEFLSPFGFYEVMMSIKESIKTSKFFPKVSELREIISPPGGWGPHFGIPNKNEVDKQIMEFVERIAKIMGSKKNLPQLPHKQ